MSLFSFSIGLILRRGEQFLEFKRQIDNGRVQFEDQLSGQIYTWPMTTVYRQINEGNLLIFRGDDRRDARTTTSSDKGSSVPLMPSLESLAEKYRLDLERKLDYVRTCQKQGLTRGQRRRIQTLVETIAIRRKEVAPSTSSVMEWWKTLEDHDYYPGALISKNVRRYRRRSLHISVLELIRKIARKEYFTRDRYPLARTHFLVNQALKKPVVIDGEVVSPSVISLSTVRRTVNEVAPYFRDVARYGPAFAKNKWRYSLKGDTSTRVMERVEIDHTLLDLVVICDKSGLPLGRPTITVVIDAYSGYVLSFFISFWGPGVGSVLNALKIAISPKDHYGAGVAGLSNPWLGHGLCELIVVDNGMEFHSRQFRLAAWHLNSDVQYCAVRQPWLKPSVERVLGTLGLYLPAAGRVHKPLSNYLPPNPRGTASITLSQLSIGLLKCFVDVLSMEPGRTTLTEPFELFREGFERLPPPIFPDSFSELNLIGAIPKQLTVGNEGVVFEYLRYNSVDLQDLRRKTSLRFKTVVKFDPSDLDFVYVQDPLTKHWILVPSCHPEYTRHLSIVQHRAIRAHLKSKLHARGTIEALLKAKAELIDLYDGFLKGNKGKKNVAAAQKFGTLTSAQSLLMDSQIVLPAPPEEKLVTVDEFMPTSKEVPAFSSFMFD